MGSDEADQLIQRLNAMKSGGQLSAAIEHWRAQNAASPTGGPAGDHLAKVASSLNRYGVILFKRDEIEAALDYFELAILAAESFVPALNNAGNCLKELGRGDESGTFYRRALALQPGFSEAEGNLLLNMQYDARLSLKDLLAAHKEWGDRFAERAARAPLSVRPRGAAGLPLRVGLLSSDLGQHPVGIFLLPFLEHADRERIAFVSYMTSTRVGGLTTRMHRAVAEWCDAEPLSDDALAARIAADKIDILIDLNGHTEGHRLGVLALRPAPLQLSWLGYPGETGSHHIDYVIGDRYVLPESMQPLMRAKILQLPHSFVCFDPPLEAPDVTPLSVPSPGEIIFSAFHNPAKIGSDVVKLWAQILLRLPKAQLLFKYKGFGSPTTERLFRERFAEQGVAGDRLHFQGASRTEEMFRVLGSTGIALDPFPFAGGLMTCFALWMGVPVITYPGDRFASRQGLSFLSTIGITETIASSAEDYIEKAVALAEEPDRLRSLRSRLRPTMAASPLCDGQRAMQDLEALLIGLWRNGS